MALLKKKTRKRLRKFVKQHGDAVVTGLITSALAAFATRNADSVEDFRQTVARRFGVQDDRKAEQPTSFARE